MEIERSVYLSRARAVASHNTPTKIFSPSFSIGDFVPVRRANVRGHMLRFGWFGPFRITSLYSQLVYGVTPLCGGQTERIHCARLIPYRDALQESTVPPAILDLAEQTESRYEVVEKIIDVGKAPDGPFFRSNGKACRTSVITYGSRSMRCMLIFLILSLAFSDRSNSRSPSPLRSNASFPYLRTSQN